MAVEESLQAVSFALVRFSAFAANALIFGFAPILLLVLRPAVSAVPDEPAWNAGRARLSGRLEGLLQAALIASAVATAVALVLQAILTASFFSGDFGMGAIESVVETTFGKWYVARFPLLIALAVLLVGRVRTQALAGAGDPRKAPPVLWWSTWMFLGLGLLASSTFSGHSAVASPRIVAVINDLVHLCAGSIWFSGIILFALALPDGWRGRAERDKLRLLSPAVRRFSEVALIAIAIVATTGVISSVLHVGALDDLIDTGYGRALALKITVFFGILVMGAINHYHLRARLEDGLGAGDATSAHRLFRKTIATELAIALSVFGLTGILVGQARTKDLAAPRTAVLEVPGSAHDPAAQQP